MFFEIHEEGLDNRNAARSPHKNAKWEQFLVKKTYTNPHLLFDSVSQFKEQGTQNHDTDSTKVWTRDEMEWGWVLQFSNLTDITTFLVKGGITFHEHTNGTVQIQVRRRNK